MATISITVDSKQVQQAMSRAPLVVKGKLTAWVSKSALMAERSAKTNLTESVSAGSTGITRSSIHTSLGGMTSTVKPTTKESYWVHEGRKPGRMPPYQEGTSLNRWARRMGMNPFLVARSIGRKGTKGHPFMDQAYAEIKPRAERDGQALLDDIVRAL
jgi:hypothetical protein